MESSPMASRRVRRPPMRSPISTRYVRRRQETSDDDVLDIDEISEPTNNRPRSPVRVSDGYEVWRRSARFGKTHEQKILRTNEQGRTEIVEPLEGDIAIHSGFPYAKYSSEAWRKFIINQE
ncbi:uncharacterized protein LOC117172384 [Belonocnema kinseyi]|uniref:uncharacterized protein LOC117172384 n=1 Tax=Belonocnema kinseyi TaxID=2817044 RepID=UPI00143E0748|nr:uncharacterized protein LOC117172384 [Belonocnema kinseyi]